MTTALGMPGLRTRLQPSPADPSQGLVDSFGRRAADLRISLTDKCNLRCTYCMPAEGMDWRPSSELLTAAEIQRLVRIGVQRLGIVELRLTGGEPLIRPDLEEIIAGVRREHPELPISLTTNAIGLDRRAAGLRAAGLTRLNVSLDTLDRATFARLARRDRLPQVLAGIRAAQQAGLEPVKINSVLLRGINDDGAADLLAWTLEQGLQLRFIEQMPLDEDRTWTRRGMVTAAEIRQLLSRHFRLDPRPVPRAGAPAELWDVRALDAELADEPLGTVGIIASVTEPFCGDCRRTRLTAEGEIRSCLFSHEEFGLRDLLRGQTEQGALPQERADELIAERWRAAMWVKPAAHGMDRTGLGDDGFVQPVRSMSAIGG
ncbi:GTP 3',8-cyclase MoaA [Kocuria palustris]|jgi:cyclic pyranopterin phosphate synthase|uniref:GTP 3',8-cyclase MoaA n=1 Tax=Kocuria palustris TaxID=71999 RepID=UPI0019D3137A|nr:GTP 3',8-cyclase MoaA [Kocuria palustris]MBN6754122.1 GTP 3',8-cyclase MoaA [Kocuria palustris]MBN6758995.1 GTP 3',8-cyclase MoaA [Kocuria palustris]MBN6764225.1 GTP 3',8-cyclase MoaA [Kocuria palustris]MBN6783663.1 GTP 3',8-cyclase MoaA [Kocuria palustris]MBN6800153.1 GTP 3',8-cyclase MoaA [Kocuria palustris]